MNLTKQRVDINEDTETHLSQLVNNPMAPICLTYSAFLSKIVRLSCQSQSDSNSHRCYISTRNEDLALIPRFQSTPQNTFLPENKYYSLESKSLQKNPATAIQQSIHGRYKTTNNPNCKHYVSGREGMNSPISASNLTLKQPNSNSQTRKTSPLRNPQHRRITRIDRARSPGSQSL